MIPTRLNLYFSILFIFLLLLSCQKKDIITVKQKSTKAEVEKLIIIADRFYDNKEYDSAFSYYNKVKFICNPVTDAENYVTALDRMADIQQTYGDYTGSESTVTETLAYLKYIKDPKYAWDTYIILGINYVNTYDYKNALFYYNEALKLKTTEWQKQTVKSNIAFAYMEQKKYEEAIQIFLPLTTNKTIQEFPEDHARALDHIGYCYFKINDPKALSYMQKALKIRSEIQHNRGIGTSYHRLAQFYINKNPSLAKKFMKLSYEKFTIVNNIDDRMLSLKLLIENSSDGELKKYSTIYVNLVDSIFEVRQKAKNQFAKIKYDSKKEKDENLKLKTHRAENELQLEKQKNRNIISYIIIALSLSLIIVLYFYLTSKGNREKIEATYKSETRIAKKLHDELANDIYHTMAFAENKNLSLSENKEQLIQNLNVIYSRTRDISKENSPIITSEKYTLYLKEMIAGFNTPDINLLLNGIEAISWKEIEENKKITVYRVLQELLVNMKKHSSASLVVITFKTTDKNVIVTYSDNGKGIDPNTISIKNGLHNVENRILAIKGKIDIDSSVGKGFKVFFEFPL
ncbi:ATP-binding protein [Flavobacterium sp. FlaQc-48]|uniref:tetratricopeptide repeat-containing sensor histidine kinase n=1 Tax=Flavobacterium sp. FlaQc-48 TaxID=3374181 RepID=UPI003756D73B